MIQPLSDYYRIPDDFFGRRPHVVPAPGEVGFFRFGANTICYGRSASGVSNNVEDSARFDASQDIRRDGATVQIPFDFAEVIENLRLERYQKALTPTKASIAEDGPVRQLYYLVREYLPVSFRRHLQRAYFRGWKNLPFPAWPVDFTADTLHEDYLRLLLETNNVEKVPFIWFWPDGAPSCLVMTHDVETRAGRDFTGELMDLDDSYGIKASFQVIPERRYDIPDDYLSFVRNRGFEVNVHDLYHDGHLYQTRDNFVERAGKINEYARKFGASGFRAGVMYRNLDWYSEYKFSYDMSVPTVAHLEPQRGGCCTVFPYFVGDILEIPLTTTQDYSLFQILKDFSIDLWIRELNLIQRRNGLMSFIAHPDYLISHRSRKVYEALLSHLQGLIAREKIWSALPGELDRWWRARRQMSLVQKNGCWEIEGPEAKRARVAFASLEGGRIIYECSGLRDRADVRS